MASKWIPLSAFRSTEVHAVPGRFATNTTNDPVVLEGDGYAVVYAATGIFNLTFDDYFGGVLAIPFEFQVAATSEHRVTLTGFSAGDPLTAAVATAQFSISLLAADAYTASATSTGDQVHFCAIFSKAQGSG